MQFNEVINATPHPIDVYDEDGERIVLELAHNPEDPIARCGERIVRLIDAGISGVKVAVHGTSYTGVTGLPEPRDGVWYVVALPVAIVAPGRTDLLVCGPAVRDDKNRMIGCKGLSVAHHPVAAHPEPRRFQTKEDLEELDEPTAGCAPADWYTPYGMARALFAEGLISKEELDLAKRDFGDDWTYSSGAHSNPNYTPTLDDAIEALSTTYRYELKDSAFGDSEIHWVIRPYENDTDPQVSVADGYIGGVELSGIGVTFPNGDHAYYEGHDAWKLSNAGQRGAITENSSMTTRY